MACSFFRLLILAYARVNAYECTDWLNLCPMRIGIHPFSCNAANELAFLDLASISASFALASASAIIAAAEYEFISAADVVLFRVHGSVRRSDMIHGPWYKSQSHTIRETLTESIFLSLCINSSLNISTLSVLVNSLQLVNFSCLGFSLFKGSVVIVSKNL